MRPCSLALVCEVFIARLILLTCYNYIPSRIQEERILSFEKKDKMKITELLSLRLYPLEKWHKNMEVYPYTLNLLHLEKPKLYTILAFLNAVGLK